MSTDSLDVEAGLFESLYVEQHAPLVRFLTRLTRCPARAEDLAQATWLKLLGVRDRGAWTARGAAELRAYLYASARNLFLDEYTRKHASTRTRTVDPGDLDAVLGGTAPQHGPEGEVAQAQTRAHVGRALAALPAEQRAVIVMWVNGTSLREMAAHAGAPVDTVLSRKKYALARMRRTLVAVAAHDCATA
jgi:RNA polymerase sigma factor (sigma-70 family)